MTNATMDDSRNIRSQVGEASVTLGDVSDFNYILRELGACGWSGTVTPLRAYVKSPVPDPLSDFEREGVNWFECIYPQDSERVIQNLGKASRGEAIPAFEYRMITEKSEIVWVRHWWAKTPGSQMANHGSGRVEGFVQVINERKELEAECIRASERERHQIGQELHDDVCQILAGLACMLELVGRQVKTTIPGLSPTVAELVRQVNGGMERARSLAHGLVPFRLLNLGLPVALAEFAGQASTSRGVKICTCFSRDLPTHSPDQTLHLYRIAQEAVGNAIEHGRATKITLSLRQRGRRMSLTVCDNGAGLLATAKNPPGLGLHIMHHRAFEIGADFSISSPPSGGTTVTIRYSCAEPSTNRRKLRL